MPIWMRGFDPKTQPPMPPVRPGSWRRPKGTASRNLLLLQPVVLIAIRRSGDAVVRATESYDGGGYMPVGRSEAVGLLQVVSATRLRPADGHIGSLRGDSQTGRRSNWQ